MPPVDPQHPRGKILPGALRRVRVHEPVRTAGGLTSARRDSVPTQMIAETVTDSSGRFFLPMPPGVYSVFVEEDSSWYFNGWNGEGIQGAVTVEPGKPSEHADQSHHEGDVLNLDLQGRNYLVTAASKGLGFSIARELLREGARVMLSSSSAKNLADAARTAVGGEAGELPDVGSGPDARGGHYGTGARNAMPLSASLMAL